MSRVIAAADVSDPTGDHRLVAKLLHEFRQPAPGLEDGRLKKKMADMWEESSKHDVLFSDHTRGDVEQFVEVFLDPASVWMEIVRKEDQEVLGSVYVTQVAPQFEAYGHFTFWDSHAKGRAPFLHKVMWWIFERYSLHRLNAEVPTYQSGWMAFVEGGLGFKKEGVKREGTLYKGEWVDLEMFGLLREELEELLEEGSDDE